VIRANGPTRERHLRFVGSLAAFYIIASQAGADQVFPRVLAAAAFRHDVIDRKSNARRAAILAFVPIAAKNIFSRENYFLERHSNVSRKPYYARKRHRNGSRMNRAARHCADQLGFFEIKQDNCFFNAGDCQRLVVAVQNENLAAKLRVSRAEIGVILEAELRDCISTSLRSRSIGKQTLAMPQPRR